MPGISGQRKYIIASYIPTHMARLLTLKPSKRQNFLGISKVSLCLLGIGTAMLDSTNRLENVEWRLSRTCFVQPIISHQSHNVSDISTKESSFTPFNCCESRHLEYRSTLYVLCSYRLHEKRIICTLPIFLLPCLVLS